MEIVEHVVVSKAWRREDEAEEHDEVCMQCSINVRSGAPQRLLLQYSHEALTSDRNEGIHSC